MLSGCGLERQKAMGSLDKQLNTLKETYRQLREDQARVKNDHSILKEKLDALKCEVKVHLDHLNSMDQHMSKLGLEQVQQGRGNRLLIKLELFSLSLVNSFSSPGLHPLR